MGNEMPWVRRELQRALLEWRDAGGPVEMVTDYIEGMISGKVYEILQARADNACFTNSGDEKRGA